MRDLLDIKLLSQSFKVSEDSDLKLNDGKLIAEMYARLENCISVLSDMRSLRSYLYYGAIAQQFGLSHQQQEIGSIWEDELLSRVNADDLQKKYRLELQFFQLLNSIGPEERNDYQAITKLRIRNIEGKYILIKHRLLYIGSTEDGTIRLALCLYNIIYDHPEHAVPGGVIINTSSGKTIEYNQYHCNALLSPREKEVLRLIKNGHRSKEIADKLLLSINTVNRHRQNIFQKFNVTNAMEACNIADTAGIW